ncbi:hypothetical protein RJ639_025178 [Escallonia herrerae]|nr:hypothetical protein RJ639_025178 [Escallonia herrerae]
MDMEDEFQSDDEELTNYLENPTDKIPTIKLSQELKALKFSSEEDYRKALEQGPWFIGTNYLSVQTWTPNFNPHVRSISYGSD